MLNFRSVTCNRCGRVHVAVPRSFAESEVVASSDFYQKLNPGSAPMTIERYQKCFACGNDYKNFREALPDDCPVGCTLTSILDFDESTQGENAHVGLLQ
jgi:hypothetical protein